MTQGYAYEIRFVDDNKVQVFDLARRHVDPTSATLPTEYKAEEVLRGDLRYSKLLGAQQNVTEEQWEHITYTKRGRRSIQRHTFMMGSHSTEHDAIMDLEVGNKDIADIRFNESNICQNNRSNNISAVDKNSSTISIRSTSLDSSVTGAIGNSSEHSQPIHFGFEEADMANLLKKPSPSVHEDNAQLVASQTLDDIGTADPYLKSNMRNHSVKRQNQHQPVESGYSTNGQREKISLSSSWNSGEDKVDANHNQSDKGDLEQNSFEYKMDGMAMKSSTQYRNDRVSKSKRESNNSKMPIQTQQLNHENAHQKEQYFDGKHQIGQVLSKMETKNNHNTHTHTPSNEKAFYHSTNTPVTNNNGNETLTRVKSVSLENYEASPERSCCIIS